MRVEAARLVNGKTMKISTVSRFAQGNVHATYPVTFSTRRPFPVYAVMLTLLHRNFTFERAPHTLFIVIKIQHLSITTNCIIHVVKKHIKELGIVMNACNLRAGEG